MRILIVDDQILFQQGLVGLIDGQPDLQVVGGAGSVAEAVAKTRELQPDVVLMDFMLPDGTGLDATRTILAERPQTQIVFLTVHEESEMLFEAVRLGARGYLPKNIPAAQLLTYLQNLKQGEAAIPPQFINRILEEFAHTEPRAVPEESILAGLTPRQLEILRELRDGATNYEIANNLVISEQTVKNHISHILAILKVRSRHEAAQFARRFNL